VLGRGEDGGGRNVGNIAIGKAIILHDKVARKERDATWLETLDLVC